MSWLSVPTDVERGPDDATQRMAQAVHDAIGQAGLESRDVVRVGLGSPGTMDVPGGRLLYPSNLKGWDLYPIRDKLRDACGLPVTFANDANAAAYGEFWVGAGRELDSIVLLTLGTGVGCGIIIEGLALNGQNSHGGESGHNLVNPAPDARWCNCGQRGHLEAYASATGLTRRTQEMLDAGLQTSIAQRITEGEELSAKLVAEEAERGDQLALQVVLDTAEWLGIGLVSLIHTIDPRGVLLGGAMTFGGADNPVGIQFLQRVREEINARVFPFLAERLFLDYAVLGGDAGFIGAAGMAREEYLKSA